MNNIENRRESTNVEDRRGKPTKVAKKDLTDEEYTRYYNKLAKDRDIVRQYAPGANDQWDENVASKVAKEQWDKHHDTKGYPLESYEIDFLKQEKAKREAGHDAPDTKARQDKTRVDPRVARRRGLNGEDLGEYKMKQ